VSKKLKTFSGVGVGLFILSRDFTKFQQDNGAQVIKKHKITDILKQVWVFNSI
jgi:hypothetical protein